MQIYGKKWKELIEFRRKHGKNLVIGERLNKKLFIKQNVPSILGWYILLNYKNFENYQIIILPMKQKIQLFKSWIFCLLVFYSRIPYHEGYSSGKCFLRCSSILFLFFLLKSSISRNLALCFLWNRMIEINKQIKKTNIRRNIIGDNSIIKSRILSTFFQI